MERQPMPTQQIPSQVRALVDEYRAARAAGQVPDIEEVLARHPEFADQLRPLLEAEAAFPADTPPVCPPTPAPVAQIDIPTLDFPLAGSQTHSEQPTLAGAFVPPP